jgi:site-specific DNA-methyltransferase (cytosine-N4-specific)
MFVGKVEDALEAPALTKLRGKVNLILTSPPFPLVTKKQYGNETGETYINWLASLAPRLIELLTEDGSIVLEIGNAWVKSLPVMSTLPLEALLTFKKAGDLHLCQQIICHNPARLPGPAAWVNVKRFRLKDSFTHVWWMSRSPTPKADNRRVLTPYSSDMRKLLKTQRYNAGRRPSGHVISDRGFLNDHGGAIAPNVIDLEMDQSKLPGALLKFSGTVWDTRYRQFCQKHGSTPHPARMPMELAAFFVKFLTDADDLVFDPFAGSNTTGAAAESLERRWISVEARHDYAEGSRGRFDRDQGVLF